MQVEPKRVYIDCAKIFVIVLGVRDGKPFPALAGSGWLLMSFILLIHRTLTLSSASQQVFTFQAEHAYVYPTCRTAWQKVQTIYLIINPI